MEDPSLPKSDPPQPSTGEMVGKLVGANLAVLVLLWIAGRFDVMLTLPVLNVVAGIVLLRMGDKKRGEKRLGLILVLSGLVGLMGLGTCALILSNVSVRN